MLTNVSTEDVGECPACGREPAAVTPFTLPAEPDAYPGGACIVAAVEGEHFDRAVYPDYRPDVLALTHQD